MYCVKTIVQLNLFKTGLFTELMVGVNKYRLKEQEEVDVLCIYSTPSL